MENKSVRAFTVPTQSVFVYFPLRHDLYSLVCIGVVSLCLRADRETVNTPVNTPVMASNYRSKLNGLCSCLINLKETKVQWSHFTLTCFYIFWT